MRLPAAVGGGQVARLLGLYRKLRAVALCAKLNVAVRIESEVVAAGNVVQPSVLDLEILRCSAQRSHHRADVVVADLGGEMVGQRVFKPGMLEDGGVGKAGERGLELPAYSDDSPRTALRPQSRGGLGCLRR